MGWRVRGLCVQQMVETHSISRREEVINSWSRQQDLLLLLPLRNGEKQKDGVISAAEICSPLKEESSQSLQQMHKAASLRPNTQMTRQNSRQQLVIAMKEMYVREMQKPNQTNFKLL